MKLPIRLSAALLAASITHAATLPASEDTYGFRAKLTLAANKAATLPVDATHRAFLYFNLADLPPGATLRYARLRLYLPRVVRAGGGLSVHQVTGTWDESLASAEPTFTVAPFANLPAIGLRTKRFISVDVTATVQAWLAAPATNEGFAIAAIPGATAKLTASVSLGAKEGSGSGYPAELDVEIADDPIAPGAVGTTQLAPNLTLGGTTTGTFSGSLAGIATGFTGTLTGDVTGTQGTTVVSTVGGVTAAAVAAGATLANTAITPSGSFSLPATSGATVGVITQGGSPLIHTFGINNFFAGTGAGNFTMTGSSNTASGVGALQNNFTGSSDTAHGLNALFSNTIGNDNTAIGATALQNNTTGNNNSASGVNALAGNTTGDHNTANGANALRFNTTGSSNTASGVGALQNNMTGVNNVASGVNALQANTTGSSNTALGQSALFNNTTADNNTAIGHHSLFNNTTGFNNIASGLSALASNTTGNSNTAYGINSLQFSTTGDSNTGIGLNALQSNTTGTNNTAIGTSAGNALTSGSNNIDIGNVGVAGESGIIRIGTTGNQSKTFIAGIRGVTTGVANGVTVLIDGNGQLGTISSSRRYKEDIADMGDTSARIGALRPVTFRYKNPYADGGKPVQYGLIAEEVAEVFPELTVFNEDGQPETVKYQDITPLLLNEFLKERRRTKDVETALREENADLKKRLERLETLLPATTAK